MPLLINDNTATAISSDFQPPNSTVKVQVSGLTGAKSVKVEVRAKVDLAGPYEVMHTFRATSEKPRCFVAYPYMEFEMLDNDAGNAVQVWAV